MDNNIHAQGEQLTLSHNRRKRWYKLMCILAGIVVFCTVYALILPAITLTNATVSPGGSATIAIGETVTCNGTSGNKDEWSASPAGLVTIGTGDDGTATITGVAAGTATVTHKYKGNQTETFTITVTGTDSGGDDDESSIEKAANEDGYTVTVKGNQKILEGAELFVEEIDPAEDGENAEYYSAAVSDMKASTFDFMKMYHIYLSKDGGTTEYDPSADEALSNTNINLQVTITYDTAPEGWPTGNGNLYVGHYKKVGNTIENKGFTDAQGIKQIKVSGNSITFHINSFSVITMAAPTGAADTDTDIIPGNGGTYGESLVQSAKNSWQIVSGGYEGNAVANKTVSTDGLVRVQKNVVPTDKENEFLIYLSIDKKVSWEEVIGSSNLLVTTSGSYKTIGESYSSIHGNYGEVSPIYSESAKNEYTATVTLTRNGTVIDTITQQYYGTVPKCSNATGFLELTIGNSTYYVVASTSVNLHDDSSGSGGALTYTVPLESLESKFDFADYTVTYDGVSDTMGDYIKYDSTYTPVGNYKTAPAYETSTSTLLWTPVEKAGLSPVYTDDTKITGWYLNSAELVYKVKLDVTKDDFQSAAEYLTDQTKTDSPYDTNAAATLSYHWTGEDANARRTTFTSPQVRGLLYDVSFDKVDANDTSTKLSGAEFELKDSSGTVYRITETDEKGIYKASNLPYGTYTLMETKAPDGYSLDDENSTWEITLSYTDDKDSVAQDTSNQANMIYTGNNNPDGVWQITNEKKNIYVDIIKTDMSYEALNGATFSIYDTDPSAEGAAPMADYGELSANEFGVIADNMLLENDKTYYLVETKAPDGYKLPTENVTLTVNMSVLSDEEEATGDAGSGTNADGGNEILPIIASGGSGEVNISKEKQTIGDDETETTVYVIKIPNSPGVILPSTGGTGTLPYTLGGAGLVLAAALMYGYSMRRKRERRLM